MSASTATREGVVNSRSEAMAEILKNREAQIDEELKEGGTKDGIAVLTKDQSDADPLKPESVPAEDWAAMSDEQKNLEIAAEAERKKAAEAKSEVVEETAEEKSAREAKEAEEKAATEAAAAPKKIKGKVDGQEVEFDESKVMEAGLRALQKESTADKRLEEATKAREEADRLKKAAEQAAAAAAAAPAKKTDQEVLAEKDALRPIVKAIQYGGEDEAAAALLEYGQKMAQLGQANAITAAELHNMLDLREAQKYVRTEYADVMSDEKLKKLFVSEVNAKLATGDARPYQEICKDVGDELRTWKGAPAKQEATQPAKPQGASRAAVHERKTSTVQVPSAAARQPAPTQPKAENPTDTVARMREARDRASGRIT